MKKHKERILVVILTLSYLVIMLCIFKIFALKAEREVIQTIGIINISGSAVTQL